MLIAPIAHVRTPYPTKFGVPRQPHLAPSIVSSIEFDDVRLELLQELEPAPGAPLCVLWGFSHNEGDSSKWSKTIRPPLLGGTKRMGVFASRSSFRPNGLALSCIVVQEVTEDGIAFTGADMVDGTPVFALLPYDHGFHQAAANAGWQASVPWPKMEKVVIPQAFHEVVPGPLRAGLIELLAQDPRPAHTRQGSEARSFWVALEEYVLWFQVLDRTLVVTNVRHLKADELATLKETGNLPFS